MSSKWLVPYLKLILLRAVLYPGIIRGHELLLKYPSSVRVVGLPTCPTTYPHLVQNNPNGWAGLLCFDTLSAAAAGHGSPTSWCLLNKYESESRAAKLVEYISQGTGKLCPQTGA